jgi:hypothetical protein
MKPVISRGVLCSSLSSLLAVGKSPITTGIVLTLARKGGRE